MAAHSGNERASRFRGQAGSRSVYSRSVILLAFTNVVIFMLMALVYYGAVSVSLVRQQNRQLQATAQALADELASTVNPATGRIDGFAASTPLAIAARAGAASAWVVDRTGAIVLKTGVPQPLAGRLQPVDGGYRLPAAMIGGPGLPAAGVVAVDGLNKSLDTLPEDWSTAVVPIRLNGSYWGEVQLQRVIDYSDRDRWFIINGLSLSLIVAFAISIIIIGMLSHTITRPIRLMSEAAERVSQGDLTAKVELPGVETPATGVVTDDLTRLATTINHMVSRLKEQDQERRDFIASVSHDLRTPITSINGFVEGMLDGTIPPARHGHYLGTVKTEALRMQGLVNGMFEVTMLDSGSTRYHQRPFDIGDLLRQATRGLEPQLNEKRLAAQVQTPPGQDATLVLGDRDALGRVINNLLANAIQFTPPGGTITASVNPVRSQLVEVAVEDSGPGVCEAEARRIFDRFYKSDRARTGKGSGLGLYICRSILSAHGQTIKVVPGGQGGARFVFTLAAPGGNAPMRPNETA